MAENLQILKRRIKTAKNIAQIAKAMEMISASKIKKAQTAVDNNKPYKNRIVKLAENLLSLEDVRKYKHPYLQKNLSGNTLVVVFSPDKGLCGSLNTNLNKTMLGLDHKKTKFLLIGKKASRFQQSLATEIVADFTFGTSLPDYSEIYRLAEIIDTLYLGGEVSKVQLLYTQFNSIFSQEPVLVDLLPIHLEPESAEKAPFIFEPRVEILLSTLLPYYLEVLLYTALIEAYTSEQAARMVAMQNAKNSALDIAEYVTLTYNKSRQEKITNELLTLSNNAN